MDSEMRVQLVLDRMAYEKDPDALAEEVREVWLRNGQAHCMKLGGVCYPTRKIISMKVCMEASMAWLVHSCHANDYGFPSSLTKCLFMRTIRVLEHMYASRQGQSRKR